MHKPQRFIALIFMVIEVAFYAAAESGNGIRLYPAPGFYNTPITVVISSDSAKQLYASLDGGPVSPVTAPFFLDVKDGSEKTYSFELFYAPADPASKPVSAGTAVYSLDRRIPSQVAYRCVTGSGETIVQFEAPEQGVIMYSVYNPETMKLQNGSLVVSSKDASESLQIRVPNAAVFAAFLIDRAGNKSDPVVVDLGLSVEYTDDFTIVNPVPGVWENKQMLVINNHSGVDVRYTLDGSDPRINGILYERPVLIDALGKTQLRAATVGGYSEKTVLFMTGNNDVPPELMCIKSDSVIEAKEFTELSLPSDSLYIFGESAVPYLEGKILPIAAIPGTSRYLPISVSYHGKLFRNVLYLNNRASGTEPAASDLVPVIPISGRLYHALTFSSGAAYSVDGGEWQTAEFPVFIDRQTPHEIRWYMPSYKSGEMQKLFLSGKASDIAVSGIPVFGRSSEPVMIKPERTDLELRYEIGFDWIPPLPTKDSPLLGSGILVSAPQGDQFNCIIRIATFRGRYSDGDMITSFLIDRRNPPSPIPTVSGNVPWSREPVSINWTSGDANSEICHAYAATKQTGSAVVYPDVPEQTRNSRPAVISGEPGVAVAYTATACAVDKCGNTSRIASVQGIIERNAWYVTESMSGDKSGDGSPASPSVSLDDVLDQVAVYADAEPCYVYVSGNHILTRSHMLNRSVIVLSHGEKTPSVTFTDSAFIAIQKSGVLSLNDIVIAESSKDLVAPLFSVTGGKLQLDSCIVTASGCRSVIRSDNGFVTAKKCQFNFSGESAVSALEFMGSTVDFYATDITVVGNSFAQGLSVSGGSCSFNNGTIQVSAADESGAVLAVSVFNAIYKTDAAIIFVTAGSVGRAIDAVGTQIFITDSIFRYESNSGTMTAACAVSLDASSILCRSSGNKIAGFSTLTDTAKEKR